MPLDSGHALCVQRAVHSSPGEGFGRIRASFPASDDLRRVLPPVLTLVLFMEIEIRSPPWKGQ